MKLSVVILNYNVRFFLEQCVKSVCKATKDIDAEIIVVDNNSSDDSCKMMRERYPNVILIENNENLGFPKGNNIGVAASKGEYICILNPDTVVAEDTFDKVLAFAEKQDHLGIVGVKLIDGTGRFLPESKRGVPTPFVACTKILGLYKLFPKNLGKYYASHVGIDQTGKVDILVGAFMVMKKDTYLEVGGFDEKCFMYSDDIDLSYMILKTGRQNFYFAETSVIHYKGESTIKDHAYMQHFQQAMDFFYKKHFRSSFVFDTFMKVGAYVFSAAKQSKPELSIKNIEHYILLSDNPVLEKQIEGILRKEVMLERELVLMPQGNTEIIFDRRYINFKMIISRMEKLRSPGITFKIAHAKAGFLIGSNSSYGRGEVLKLTNYR